MRKKIQAILVLSIVFSFCFNVISANSMENVFFYDDKEIVIVGNIDYNKMKCIADFIALDNSIEKDISTYALDCLLGHNIVSGITVTEVEHNVYEDTFKCVESAYDVEYCSRPSCNYFMKTLLYRIRIGKCHG